MNSSDVFTLKVYYNFTLIVFNMIPLIFILMHFIVISQHKCILKIIWLFKNHLLYKYTYLHKCTNVSPDIFISKTKDMEKNGKILLEKIILKQRNLFAMKYYTSLRQIYWNICRQHCMSQTVLLRKENKLCLYKEL